MRARSSAKKTEEPIKEDDVGEPAEVESVAENQPVDVGKPGCYMGEDIPPLPGPYAPIVETLFSLEEPETLYEQVEQAIRPIRASRADYGSLVDALDKSQEVARLAMQLLVNARTAASAYERDAETALAALRHAASEALEQEKERGERKKAITEGDIAARIASSFPEDYQEIRTNRDKIKRLVDYLEDLHVRASERAKDLRMMAGNARA